LKATDKQSRIRIPKSVVRIHGSGCVPKCHRTHTLLVKHTDFRYPSYLPFFKFLRYFLAKKKAFWLYKKLYSSKEHGILTCEHRKFITLHPRSILLDSLYERLQLDQAEKFKFLAENTGIRKWVSIKQIDSVKTNLTGKLL
jgi:hypothetical protein